MIPSNGWGHNPISPNDYKVFFLDLELSELIYLMHVSEIVKAMAEIDGKFLSIEAAKQDSKSSKSSSPKSSSEQP